ncbi:MAG: hydantoinase/oxoprolinase family protein, partial [Deltaproteobacteria bacterium]|nr:hydantoinase/oxoprolinase family protein [Deltaproteobacteria bacterium]
STLGLDLYQAAQGILDIVNENMFGAIRLVTVQKGLNPKDFAQVAFGGAGPLHGNALGILAGTFPVIIPPTPGVLSALGFLYSDVKNEFAQTYIRNLDEIKPDQVEKILTDLGQQAKAWLNEEGIAEQNHQIRYEVDVRYFRQGYEFPLEIQPHGFTSGGLKDIQSRFGLLHEQQYGFQLDSVVEIVNLRAVGTGKVIKLKFAREDRGGPDASKAIIEKNRVYFDGNFRETNIYQRDLLSAGNRVSGPAVIVQKDSTSVIHPGYAGVVDEYRNILINPV